MIDMFLKSKNIESRAKITPFTSFFKLKRILFFVKVIIIITEITKLHSRKKKQTKNKIKK